MAAFSFDLVGVCLLCQGCTQSENLRTAYYCLETMLKLKIYDSTLRIVCMDLSKQTIVGIILRTGDILLCLICERYGCWVLIINPVTMCVSLHTIVTVIDWVNV